MRHRKDLLSLVLIALLAAAVGGCAKKKTAATTPTPSDTREPAQPPEPSPPAPPRDDVEDFPTEPPVPQTDLPLDDLARRNLKTVYFSYDRSDLTPAALATLRENGVWLKANTSYDVVVEGHCDERGTIEYNLALAERRARAVRDYLTSLGVPAARLRIVTYGEERPATPGHDESAWSKNRRAEFGLER